MSPLEKRKAELIAMKEARAKATQGEYEVVDDRHFLIRCKEYSKRDPAWRDWICTLHGLPIVGQDKLNAEFLIQVANQVDQLCDDLILAIEALERISGQQKLSPKGEWQDTLGAIDAKEALNQISKGGAGE